MSKELLLKYGRRLVEALPDTEAQADACGREFADVLNELFKEAKVVALENAAAKLEAIAARAEAKGEAPLCETTRSIANRLYASWLRTEAHGKPVPPEIGTVDFDKEQRDAVIDECLAAIQADPQSASRTVLLQLKNGENRR